MAPTFSRFSDSPDLTYVPYQSVDIAELLCGTLPPGASMEAVLLDRRQWLFDRITSDPEGLAQAMDMLGIILTGSAALAFALPNIQRRDFDFVIPRGSLESVISTFAKWGYKVDTSDREETSAQGLTPITSVQSVTKLVSHSQIGDDNRKTFTSIDLIESSTSNVLEPLFSFHTTASMLFLSSRSFFMAYPEFTLTMRNAETAAYKADRQDGPDLVNTFRQFKLLEKYEDKGFISIPYPYPAHDESLHSLCGKKLRSVHDKHGLHIVLDRKFNGIPEEQDDTIGTWRLGGSLQICANCIRAPEV